MQHLEDSEIQDFNFNFARPKSSDLWVTVPSGQQTQS